MNTGLSVKGRSICLIGLLGLSLLSISVVNLHSKPVHRKLLNEINEIERKLDNLEHELSDETIVEPRPVMHTFFEEVPGGCCGMSEQGHRNLVNAWEGAWQSFGWDTKILTKADARKHPDFDLFEEKMTRANISDYNRRCFWRWLAMAMLDEGGWISDYDNIPLTLTAAKGRELMKQPGFKTWGLHVPALIHSDQLPYSHIVGLMRAHITRALNDVEHMTDMYMLKYLVENLTAKSLGATVWEHAVHPGFPYTSTRDGPKIDCNVANRYLTAHLSHYDSKLAYETSHRYPNIEGMVKGEAAERRGEAAGIMLRDLREHCIGQ